MTPNTEIHHGTYVLPATEIPSAILDRLREPRKPVVVMMCGIAGSGKSTLAKALSQMSKDPGPLHVPQRLSIDEYVWEQYGQYGVDYDMTLYTHYQQIAEDENKKALLDNIRQGRCTVLDYSFWAREWRDEYRALISAAGGDPVLVYFDVPEATLRARLAERALRRDANAAFEITPATLDGYLKGFERPVDEEKITIVVE